MIASADEIARYSEVVDRHAIIHAGPSDGHDMTLCGAALEGERGGNQMLRTRRRITCSRCIGIIRYCRTIPTRLWKRPALTTGN